MRCLSDSLWELHRTRYEGALSRSLFVRLISFDRSYSYAFNCVRPFLIPSITCPHDSRSRSSERFQSYGEYKTSQAFTRQNALRWKVTHAMGNLQERNR